jgi:hypothetical protein
MRLPWASIEESLAPKLAQQAKPAKRVKGEDLAGAFDGEFGGGISPCRRRTNTRQFRRLNIPKFDL